MENNNADDIHREKRKSPRFTKNYIMSFIEKGLDKVPKSITQIKNINEGGLCFITEKSFEKGVELVLELQTPYLSEKTHLSGVVLESCTKIEGLLYETRLAFKDLSTESAFLIKKMSCMFKGGDLGDDE